VRFLTAELFSVMRCAVRDSQPNEVFNTKL
jgi:hypothetical protein